MHSLTYLGRVAVLAAPRAGLLPQPIALVRLLLATAAAPSSQMGPGEPRSCGMPSVFCGGL